MVKKNQRKEFIDYIRGTVLEILQVSDLPHYTYDIVLIDHYMDNHTSDGSHNSINAEIHALPEYQNFTLDVFKSMFDLYKEKNFQELSEILCHEIGHLHTQRLFSLSQEPFKTAQEITKANEELTTKIGYYLFGRLNEYNHKK